jgi:hypothetical protein
LVGGAEGFGEVVVGDVAVDEDAGSPARSLRCVSGEIHRRDENTDVCLVGEAGDGVGGDGWDCVDHEVCLYGTESCHGGGQDGSEVHVGEVTQKVYGENGVKRVCVER